MKKIFKTPEVKVLFVEPSMNCMSGGVMGNSTNQGVGGKEDDWNEETGYGFAPVRMDIFNYGGLQ